MNSLVYNNWFSFTKALATFAMVNLSNFIQNLVKYIRSLDTYWCNVWRGKIQCEFSDPCGGIAFEKEKSNVGLGPLCKYHKGNYPFWI